MNFPAPVKMLRPFQEALDFQMSRSAMTAANAEALAPEARPRAFWITGLQRQSSILDAKRMVDVAIAKNWTKGELADAIGKVVDANGGTILSPDRLELIAHNAMVTDRMAGKWAQMTEFAEDRPFWRYSLGPDDDHTSDICRKLQGFTARYDDEAWKHIFPPNHHKERHDVDSLTAEEAGGDVYASPNGAQYPMIDGQTILPDPGWDYSPGDAAAVDGDAFAKSAGELAPEAPAKTPAAYNLGAISDAKNAPAFPTQGTAAGAENARRLFGQVFEIAEGERASLLVDYAKDGVWVTEETFARVAGETESFPAFAATLREPTEVWFIPRGTGEDAVFVKRYLGAFRGTDGQLRVTVVDRSPQGWLMDARTVDEAGAEELRRGLMAHSKVPKRGRK